MTLFAFVLEKNIMNLQVGFLEARYCIVVLMFIRNLTLSFTIGKLFVFKSLFMPLSLRRMPISKHAILVSFFAIR